MSEPAMAPVEGLTRVDFETGHPGAGTHTHGSVLLSPAPLALARDQPLLCVQSVPGLMTAPDFCTFVRPSVDALLHMRMLRPTTERNRYIVVAQFKSPADARSFADVYEGKYFLQGLIEDKCHLSEVVSVDMKPGAGAHAAATDAHDDAGTEAAQEQPRRDEPASASASPDVSEPAFPGSLLFPAPVFEGSSGHAASSSAGSGAGDCSTHPACPVCLEPLDVQRAALVTTLCNHTLHTECLAQWDLHRCPVCRHPQELIPEASTCMTCDNMDDLWMCVVCAYVGCGISTKKHAKSHFQETQHPFAMNLQERQFWTGDKVESGAVWDYVSERFVNRLLTSDEGKIVEVLRGEGPTHASGHAYSSTSFAGGSMSAQGGARAPLAGAIVDPSGNILSGSVDGYGSNKVFTETCRGVSAAQTDHEEEEERALNAALYASHMDAVVNEYCLRLESVREQHAADVEKLQGEIHAMAAALQAVEAKNEELARQVGTAHEESKQHKKQMTRRATEAEKDVRDLREENAFLKNVNESLVRDKRQWNEEVDRLTARLAAQEKECAEKDEQIRDIMLHFEAQAKVAEASGGCRANAASSSDASGGDIVGVGPSPRQKLAMKTRRR